METKNEENDSSVEKQERVDLLNKEGDIAADYLEAFLDTADLDGDIDIDIADNRASLEVFGTGLQELSNLAVLDSLQLLVRLAVMRKTGQKTKLILDIDGFRKNYYKELEEHVKTVCKQVEESGEPYEFESMNSFNRKIVHDCVSETDLVSKSEGIEPDRKVIISKK